MAGYSFYSKSNNAINAENNFKFPKTTFKKLLGVDPSKHIDSSEWHHTSKMYNRTNYFCALKLFQYILEEGDRPVWEKMKKRPIFNEVFAQFLDDYKSYEVCSQTDLSSEVFGEARKEFCDFDELLVEMEEERLREEEEDELRKIAGGDPEVMALQKRIQHFSGEMRKWTKVMDMSSSRSPEYQEARSNYFSSLNEWRQADYACSNLLKKKVQELKNK